MATEGKKKKPNNKPKPIPKSAAQKASERALYAGQQVAVEQTRSRSRQASRGFTGNRQLRAGGTQLQGYDLEKFKSDPFPGLGGGTPNLGGGGQLPATAAPRSGATSADGRNRIAAQTKARSQNRRRDNMSGPNNAERMQAEAEVRAKAAAAKAKAKAAADKKKKAKLTDSSGGNKKAIGGKTTAS